jgi:S1-C subfamily serine protease
VIDEIAPIPFGQNRPPHPFLSPHGGRGLRRVGEAQPSLTRSWVRGACQSPKLLAASLLAGLAACAAPPPPDGAVAEPAAVLTYPYAVPKGVDFPDYPLVAASNAGIYVRLRVFTDEKDVGLGREAQVNNVLSFASGTIIDPRGYVVTAAHIALSTKNKAYVITTDGRRFLGQVVAVERQKELALIKFTPFPEMAVARFADSNALKAGALALAIGTPAHKPGVVTVGKVIEPHLDQRMAYNDFAYDSPIELAMEIDPGLSGGPVLDREGRLIGMVVGYAMGASGSHAPPRPLIGLAIPSNDIRAFLDAHATE